MGYQDFFTIPRQNGIYYPGLPSVKAGTQRYIVQAEKPQFVPLKKGDKISIIDQDGGQNVYMSVFDQSQQSKIEILDTSNNITIPDKMLVYCQKENFNNIEQRARLVFEDNSKPYQQISFYAHEDATAFFYIDHTAILPWEQNVASPILVFVETQNPQLKNLELKAPAPLATPLLDINILPGNASSYTVKKGQYIQILDVKGRECSDFQAFSARALEKGIDREIDPTTTRSLMGTLYPRPGLHSKFYNCDMQPLVEIVQDTCGRHDNFGLACTSRYYEDMGYLGHVNCTDNINKELSKYHIQQRGGWVAINFFFNTELDCAHGILSDEPWSRPGDYVLLKALDDLVCINTACPSDIDAANAWQPTDIQTRIYDKQLPTRKSIGWRKETGGNLMETKKTAFHESFAKFTRDFGEYNGYWLANEMNNVGTIGEYWACREKAAVMDLSPLRKYEITGPDAEELLQLCVTRNIKKLAVGQVVYTAICYEHGGMIDDGTIFRLGEHNFRWVGGSDDSGLWIKQQAIKHNLNAYVKDSSDNLCNIALQGPLSRDILKDIFWTLPKQPNIEELEWFRFSNGRVGDFHGEAIIISRTGYSGELGYEIFCHPKDATAVFDAIWKVGEPLGLKPLGLNALNILRVEAGLIFAGYEFNDQTNPFEAGISFTVPLKSMTDDFIGRAALEERKLHPQRQLVGLDVKGGLIPSHGDCLRKGKAQIGEITSAVKSPFLGKVIALARVDTTYAKIDTEVEIGQLDGHQKRLEAKIVAFPHFDPTKKRVKGDYS